MAHTVTIFAHQFIQCRICGRQWWWCRFVLPHSRTYAAAYPVCVRVCVGLRAAEPECDSSRFIYCTYCVSHGYNKCHLFCSSNYIMHRQRLHEWNGTRYVRFSWRYIHMKYIYCYDIRFTWSIHTLHGVNAGMYILVRHMPVPSVQWTNSARIESEKKG